MTRAEAIATVMGWVDGLSGEYDASREECDERFQEAEDVMRALGVTDEELVTAKSEL